MFKAIDLPRGNLIWCGRANVFGGWGCISTENDSIFPTRAFLSELPSLRPDLWSAYWVHGVHTTRWYSANQYYRLVSVCRWFCCFSSNAAAQRLKSCRVTGFPCRNIPKNMRAWCGRRNVLLTHESVSCVWIFCRYTYIITAWFLSALA